MPIKEFHLKKVLEGMEITHEQVGNIFYKMKLF